MHIVRSCGQSERAWCGRENGGFGYDTNPLANPSPRRKPGVPVTERESDPMKEKINYAELEKKIDFNALAGRLGQLSQADNPQRKSVFTLLDRVRDQIVTARRTRGVSYAVLAKELTDAGLAVSEPTLRKYIRAQTGKKSAKPVRSAKTLPQPSADGNGDTKPVVSGTSAQPKNKPSTRQSSLSL
jgi:hypothetical protein